MILLSIGITLICFGLVAAIALPRLREFWEEREAWVAIPCVVPDVKATFYGGATSVQLGQAIDRAFDLLVQYTGWTPIKVQAALQGLRVNVLDRQTWPEDVCTSDRCAPGSVAGLTWADVRVVTVGNDLAALCHELAHVVEFHLYGKVDYIHGLWHARGIERAVREYQATNAEPSRSTP